MRLCSLLCVLTALGFAPVALPVGLARAESLPTAPCSQPTATGSSSTETPITTPMPDFQRVVERARLEVTRGVVYDPSYVHLSYPGGDVDSLRGVCTDVVVRSLRAVGIDLQRLVHEDIVKHPVAYKRGGKRADASIDHRRATPLLLWLTRHARSLPITVDTEIARASFAPGDILVWSLHRNGNAEHVGIVSDRRGSRGLPLIIHNIGPHPTEEDVLDAWQILGHFRAVAPHCSAKADPSVTSAVGK